MYAIFEILNKQFIVKKNQIIYSEKLNNEINTFIEFNKILLINDQDKLYLGNPYIENRKIIVLVLDHFKNKKVKILKFKRRKHYLKQYNHRQLITKLKIFNII